MITLLEEERGRTKTEKKFYPGRMAYKSDYYRDDSFGGLLFSFNKMLIENEKVLNPKPSSATFYQKFMEYNFRNLSLSSSYLNLGSRKEMGKYP